MKNNKANAGIEIKLSLNERRLIVSNWLETKKRYGFLCNVFGNKAQAKINELLIKIGYDEYTESFTTTKRELILLKMIRTPGIVLYPKPRALKVARFESLNSEFRVSSVRDNGWPRKKKYFRDYKFTVDVTSIKTGQRYTFFDYEITKSFSPQPDIS